MWLVHTLENQLYKELANFPESLRIQQSHRQIFKPEMGFRGLSTQSPTSKPKVAHGQQTSSPATCWLTSEPETQPPGGPGQRVSAA